MDRDEVRKVYEKLAPGLRSFATSILEDENDADDSLHDAFLSLVDAEIPDPAQIRPYLYKAVRNAAFKVLRDSVRRERKSLGWLAKASGGSEEGRDPRVQSVRAAVMFLPPDIRDVVVLHYWCDETFESVAEILAIPKTTADYRHRQAKDLLNGTLKLDSEE